MPKKKTTRKSRASARNAAATQRAIKEINSEGGSRVKAAKSLTKRIKAATASAERTKGARKGTSLDKWNKGRKRVAKKGSATRSAIRAMRKK